MDVKVKELVHIRDWLVIAATITGRGETAYLADPVLQEAGDSLMMKLGEAANRLRRVGAVAPAGVDWADAVDNRNALNPWLRHDPSRSDLGDTRCRSACVE